MDADPSTESDVPADVADAGAETPEAALSDLPQPGAPTTEVPTTETAGTETMPADTAPPEAAPAEDPSVIESQRQERAARRMRQTARDMLISMVVVTGAVLLMWLPFRHTTPADPVRVVDPAPVVEGARKAESWPVLAPVGLGSDWRCTSARITSASDGQDVVHLGYLSPTSTYVGLEQSATKATSFVRDASVGGRETGSVDVAGQTWTTYENDAADHRALVRTADGATYVVVGTGDWTQLETFASKLRP